MHTPQTVRPRRIQHTVLQHRARGSYALRARVVGLTRDGTEYGTWQEAHRPTSELAVIHLLLYQ